MPALHIMPPEAPDPQRGAPVGNQNASKPEEDKLSEKRTFRFKPSEIRGYNKAKPRDMPLRVWVRTVLNAAAGLPAPNPDEAEE